jgi:hypothetical protein
LAHWSGCSHRNKIHDLPDAGESPYARLDSVAMLRLVNIAFERNDTVRYADDDRISVRP